MRAMIALAALIGIAGGAEAQGAGPAGQWQCQMTYSELNPMGQRTSGFVRNYVIAILPDGTYQAQGQEAGASGAAPFRSQGQWRMEGPAFIARGMMQVAGSMGGMPIPFIMTANLTSPGAMSLNYQQPDPTQRYIMNRTNYVCERQR